MALDLGRRRCIFLCVFCLVRIFCQFDLIIRAFSRVLIFSFRILCIRFVVVYCRCLARPCMDRSRVKYIIPFSSTEVVRQSISLFSVRCRLGRLCVSLYRWSPFACRYVSTRLFPFAPFVVVVDEAQLLIPRHVRCQIWVCSWLCPCECLPLCVCVFVSMWVLYMSYIVGSLYSSLWPLSAFVRIAVRSFAVII